MSDQSKAPPAEKGKQSNSRVWLLLSIMLSGIIMVWAFSLPFRGDNASFVDLEKGSLEMTGDLADGSPVSSAVTADEFRRSAIALDEEFMRRVREKNLVHRVPGKKEVRRHWNRHVVSVKSQLKQLGEPEKGTLQWQERQELLESLKDGPSDR